MIKPLSAAALLMGMVAAPTALAGCPMSGSLSGASDLTNDDAIGVKLGRTLNEVWQPLGHPARRLAQDDGKLEGKDSAVVATGGKEGKDGAMDRNSSIERDVRDNGLKESEVNPLFSGDNVLPPLTQPLYDEIVAELTAVLTDSKDFFPADFGGANGGNYLGLFIRLAWHCSGSYRNTDGRGGCDGARIRFAPEFLWPDNTNLDKALRILEPTYAKYSDVISWGDLIVLMGNVAISSSGGPILGFCGGRVDDADGTASLPLGPTSVQEQLMPCAEPFDSGPEGFPGDCPVPIAPAVIGLIYVEANGPGDAPSDTIASAAQIRNIFARMGFPTDREQVALIGGGHILGKLHGACPDGPGPGPLEALSAPYVGTCETQPLEEGVTGVGTGLNTFTAGFEGPWTTTPTDWDNEYFTNLLEYKWELGESPGGGGRMQWFPFDFETGEPGPEIAMLTTDIAFIDDPDYRALVEEFARDPETFNREFAAAWYKLTTADMGPVSRCTGPAVPPAEPFQDPLPQPSVPEGADLSGVKSAVQSVVSDGESRALIGNLGYQCANTFRTTSWFGGCNGGRIRFEPQLSFSTNEGASEALALLQPIFEKYSDVISFSDLIVYAATIAVEAAGGPAVPFCPGRVDAQDGVTDTDFSPREYYLDPLIAQRDTIDILGVSAAEWVALMARPHGMFTDVTNDLFTTLISNTWVPVLEGDALTVDPINGEYRSVENPDLVIPVSVWVTLRDPETLFYVKEFAADVNKLKIQLGKAWVYLMNADRFEGPRGNVCSGEEFQFHP